MSRKKKKKLSKKSLYSWRRLINQLEIESGMWDRPCGICGCYHGKPYTKEELGVKKSNHK
jgi:hypothetical protein